MFHSAIGEPVSGSSPRNGFSLFMYPFQLPSDSVYWQDWRGAGQPFRCLSGPSWVVNSSGADCIASRNAGGWGNRTALWLSEPNRPCLVDVYFDAMLLMVVGELNYRSGLLFAINDHSDW